MRKSRLDDWDDDWDDDKVVVAREGPASEGLTTKKIFWGLAVVVLVGLIVGGVVSRDTYQFTQCPPGLLGVWSCGDPDRSDLWVEFRPDFVIFGTGGTGTMKARIVGIKFEQVGELESYAVFYKDLAGKVHDREVMLTPSGDSFRFADDPGVKWSRMDL